MPSKKRSGSKCSDLMCYVQRITRAQISDLAKNKSDYFYFDPMGGLREIRCTQT